MKAELVWHPLTSILKISFITCLFWFPHLLSYCNNLRYKKTCSAPACSWKDSQDFQTSMIFPIVLRGIFKLPARNTPIKTATHTEWWWNSAYCCVSELDGGWREFVVDRNVLATARITLLTPEEADNLSAAQQRRLNVTRRPNHLLMKAWQHRAKPPHRAQANLSSWSTFTWDFYF